MSSVSPHGFRPLTDSGLVLACFTLSEVHTHTRPHVTRDSHQPPSQQPHISPSKASSPLSLLSLSPSQHPVLPSPIPHPPPPPPLASHSCSTLLLLLLLSLIAVPSRSSSLAAQRPPPSLRFPSPPPLPAPLRHTRVNLTHLCQHRFSVNFCMQRLSVSIERGEAE